MWEADFRNGISKNILMLESLPNSEILRFGIFLRSWSNERIQIFQKIIRISRQLCSFILRTKLTLWFLAPQSFELQSENEDNKRAPPGPIPNIKLRFKKGAKKRKRLSGIRTSDQVLVQTQNLRGSFSMRKQSKFNLKFFTALRYVHYRPVKKTSLIIWPFPIDHYICFGLSLLNRPNVLRLHLIIELTFFKSSGNDAYTETVFILRFDCEACQHVRNFQTIREGFWLWAFIGGSASAHETCKESISKYYSTRQVFRLFLLFGGPNNFCVCFFFPWSPSNVRLNKQEHLSLSFAEPIFLIGIFQVLYI